ncbi:CZB domain-containing protein [Craterilacuibacter sp. RT1T]|uniref:CZB domain-containing protein n=1 Tax=Craterilacuibacter sp. RT1T TaxID=2942211 RepID=UPI0020C0D8D5|nr:CZB domain-containing protein [Craterilacuibacter sp. RT1T]MCL6264271.1 CZB domain-containing protein [Craterilacuibacter sp. RT1T]
MRQSIGQAATVSFLEVARLDHVVFKVNIYNTILSGTGAKAVSLADHHTCRLGQWYEHGRGKEEFSNYPAFRELLGPHERVHMAGRQALEALASQQGNEVDRYLVEMEAASREVLALLTRLGHEAEVDVVAGRVGSVAAGKALA